MTQRGKRERKGVNIACMVLSDEICLPGTWCLVSLSSTALSPAFSSIPHCTVCRWGKGVAQSGTLTSGFDGFIQRSWLAKLVSSHDRAVLLYGFTPIEGRGWEGRKLIGRDSTSQLGKNVPSVMRDDRRQVDALIRPRLRSSRCDAAKRQRHRVPDMGKDGGVQLRGTARRRF